MSRYLFRFGFCTPAQWKSNETHGWDDECSEMLFIRANNEGEALAWGTEVAEAFSRHLFEHEQWDAAVPSWKESGFAHWIEEDTAWLAEEAVQRIPIVDVNKMPAFSNSGFATL